MRVLIADDHPIIRKGIRNVLRQLAAVDAVDEAATRAETLDKAQTCRPDLVIMNTTLVDADAIEVLRAIKRLRPDLPVILLHPTPEAAFAQLALASGASGIITKVGNADELVDAIRTVMAGGVFVSEEITALMNAAVKSDSSAGAAGPAGP